MGLLARAAKLFTRTPASDAVEKAAGVNAYNLQQLYNFGVAGTSWVPHEPFSGAWQKHSAESNPRDPNLLAFSGVYACVTIISQDIAKLALRVILLGENGVTEKVHKSSPYHRVLRKPNDYQTSVDFVQLFVASRLIRGNAYVFKELDVRGVPRALHLLHPDRVRVMIEPKSKEIFYEYNPYSNDMLDLSKFGNDKGTVMIPARYIIHDRINCLWHPLIGTSPLFAAAITAMTGGRILMNTEKLFANMSRPSGILTAPGEIQDTTAKRLKEDFEKNYSSGNLGRTAVLGDGLEWKAMVMTSTDAQLIEQLKWTIEDVARAFRVPMYLLADVTRMTYKNSEQAAQSYYSGCLQYHIESIESRFTGDFGMNEDIEYVQFNVRSMFRMDTQERFMAYKEGIAAGVLAPNEARAFENLGPVKGGEEPRMQMQYVPLSTPVADPTKTAPPPAPAPAAVDDDEDDEPTPTDEDKAALQEILTLMKRVGSSTARAKFAFEEYEDE